MRTLKESYQILLDNFDEINNEAIFYLGICYTIDRLGFKQSLTWNESKLLLEDFRKRKPTIFSKFWWSPLFRRQLYWWPRNEAGQQERKRFLQYIIDKL